MVVVEAGQFEGHVGEFFALDFQIGRIEADHFVLFDAVVDLSLTYLLRELGSEPGFGFLDGKIGDGHIGLELELADLLNASLDHCRLAAVEDFVLRENWAGKEGGNSACRCDYRDEPSKQVSRRWNDFAIGYLLEDDNMHYRLWLARRHTTTGSFVPSKIVFYEPNVPRSRAMIAESKVRAQGSCERRFETLASKAVDGGCCP